MHYIPIVVAYLLVIGVPVLLCLVCWYSERGKELYSHGKAYADGHHFYLKESYKALPWWKKFITHNYVEPEQRLAGKIRDFLKVNCPDFHCDNIPGTVWHDCHCRSSHPMHSEYVRGFRNPCECVWRLTPKCSVGRFWSELEQMTCTGVP